MLRVVLAAGACALVGAPAASAADRVYYSNRGSNAISFVGLDGSGGGNLATSGATVSQPDGVALDPVDGLIYWANVNASKISYARLDGSGGGDLDTTGATVNQPWGVALDPVDGQIYWANYAGNKISFADLVGGGGHDLNTTGATVNQPAGVALDLAGGMIFWSNFGANTISYARLDGTGGGDLTTTGATVNEPLGVAVDATAVYWANYGANKISFASLVRRQAGDLNTSGTTMSYPDGVAVDPDAGRVYWGNDGVGGISYTRLDGSGGGDVNSTGAIGGAAGFPVLLHAPVGAGLPVITGADKVGARLGCSEGVWAPDLGASFDYRAAQSFAYSWSRNLVAIPGATTSSITAGSPGHYLCQVTASNFAGSTVQTSDAFTVDGPGGGSPPPVPPPPSISGMRPVASKLRVSPAAFPAAGSGPTVITPSRNLKHHHPTPGATVSYALNAAATVRFIIQQRLLGREQRHGKTTRCLAPTRANRRAHRCTRAETLRGSFMQAAIPGANSLRFSGRLNGHKLKPGTYTLVATPQAGGKTGRAIKITFRIVH